jgi:hypothetical protein
MKNCNLKKISLFTGFFLDALQGSFPAVVGKIYGMAGISAWNS